MTTYRTGKADYNAICDVCGFKKKASQLKLRWDGFMVCDEDWEPRNILDFYRTRNDAIKLPFTRPDDSGEYTFGNIVITDPPTGAYTATGTWIYNPDTGLYNARIQLTPTNTSVVFSPATIITGPVLNFTANTVVDRGGLVMGATTAQIYCRTQAVGTIGTVTSDILFLLGGNVLTVTEKINITSSAIIT